MRLKNILVLTISFLLSIGLIFGTFSIFNPIKLERERVATLSIVKEYFESADDFEKLAPKTVDGIPVSMVLKVLDNEDAPLGYLYEANVINTYGNIRIRVSVDVSQKIQTVDLVELNQSMYESKTINTAKNYEFQDITKIADGYAGVTSISVRGLMDMMMAIRDVHNSIPKFDIPRPYAAFYGTDYTIESTTEQTVDGASVKVEMITDGLGTVYTVTKSGIKQYGHTDLYPITLVVATNASNQIVGVLLPADLYGHTKGAYYVKALAYAQSFVNTNLNNVPDVYASPTEGVDNGESDFPDNSKRLIHSEFVIAKEVSQ